MMTAELTRLLFSPVTLVLYGVAMVLAMYAMAFSVVDRDGEATVVGRGRRARTVATVLAWLGVAAHLGHVVGRAVVAGRWPLGNMFEFSSVLALVMVVGGLVVVQRWMRRPELLGFVLLGALLTLGTAMLLYSEPGPLQPVLDTWWLSMHVSLIVFAGGVFSLAAVFNALHLLRDTAETRVAARAGSFGRGTLGAARAPADTDDVHEDVDDRIGAEVERIAAGDEELAVLVDRDDAAYREALRDSLTQRVLGVAGPWRLLGGVVLVTLLFSLVFQDASVSGRMVATMAVMTLVSWWAVPFLPDATVLDKVTYRTIAFAFPIWTFGVIAGAMWAEQSWGRFWGWDPKETSAFVTWIAYAGYLHARATRGLKRRTASWIGLASFGVVLFTYYAVNLLVVGLHSYGGIDPTATG